MRAAALAGPARTISSLFGARVIQAAALRGASEAGLWRALGVRPEDDDFPPIDDERHLDVWERVMRALDDAGFPIFYATTVRIDDYGLLGLACKTAADLRAALRLVEAHLPAYTDAITVRLEEEGDRAVLSVARAGGARLGVRCSVESALAELLGSMRAIAGAAVAPAAVTFSHRSPADTRAHRQHFGVAPRFGAARNAMELDAATLRAPLLSADAGLCRYLSAELAALSSSGVAARPAATWRERTRAALLRELPRTPRIGRGARAGGERAHLAASPGRRARHLRRAPRRDAPRAGRAAPRRRHPDRRRGGRDHRLRGELLVLPCLQALDGAFAARRRRAPRRQPALNARRPRGACEATAAAPQALRVAYFFGRSALRSSLMTTPSRIRSSALPA
ncbi:MAG: AraC family transcriptional regulator ligand-binding domain-containing protein [Polyangiaceae bacterium]